MATPGFAGKILLVNLTNRQIGSLDSAKYEAYGGGHGTAAAVFWDLCVAPGNWDLQDAFDPRNVVSLMTGPLAGTGLSFAGRTSVSGMSPSSWPVNWFCHSNFGGSFAPMLKLAGWDPTTGYPKRKTLEDLGMKHVADVLQAQNRLGARGESTIGRAHKGLRGKVKARGGGDVVPSLTTSNAEIARKALCALWVPAAISATRGVCPSISGDRQKGKKRM
jgi:hypothetical protein